MVLCLSDGVFKTRRRGRDILGCRRLTAPCRCSRVGRMNLRLIFHRRTCCCVTIRNDRTFELALKVQLSSQILEVYQQVACRLIPHIHIFSYRFADDPLQFSRHVFQEQRFFFEDRDNGVIDGFAGERNSTGEHFIQHDSQTPDIGSGIGFFATCLFGRHIRNRSHHHSGSCIDLEPGCVLASCRPGRYRFRF